jgi:hypothetical protein
MQALPQTAKKIEVKNSTVEFYQYEEDGVNVYYFDSGVCVPPGPMVNAMAGLKLLDKNSKLIMINHSSPVGLFPKIEENYKYKIIDLEDGRVQIEFIFKSGTKLITDFEDDQCSGGC